MRLKKKPDVTYLLSSQILKTLSFISGLESIQSYKMSQVEFS